MRCFVADKFSLLALGSAAGFVWMSGGPFSSVLNVLAALSSIIN